MVAILYTGKTRLFDNNEEKMWTYIYRIHLYST